MFNVLYFYAVIELMKEEARALPNGVSDVVIGGISQGGAVVYYTLLNTELAFGGAVIFSSWLPFRENFLARNQVITCCHRTNCTTY